MIINIIMSIIHIMIINNSNSTITVPYDSIPCRIPLPCHVPVWLPYTTIPLHIMPYRAIKCHVIACRRTTYLGAKCCTLEIDTSEIIVDLQRHFPMDCRWHLSAACYFAMGCSKGLSSGLLLESSDGLSAALSCEVVRPSRCPPS